MILLTGATGFVGGHLVPCLRAKGFDVRSAVRTTPAEGAPSLDVVSVGDLTTLPSLREALRDVSVVVHLAGRVHASRRTTDSGAEFRRANVDATRHLAVQAAARGVRRFVFLSTIKVNGESTAGHSFSESDTPSPHDAYGISKLEAERALLEVASSTGLEVVILRPPLVYGPGVKANFLRLLWLVRRRIPLPFGNVHNRRSLVSVWNLCDLISVCCEHPAAAGETFLVSDQHDLSTPELIRALGDALGRPARLFACPLLLLRAPGRLLGRSDEVERLIGSLQVDSTKATEQLGWRPPVTVADGIARTCRWYLTATAPPRRGGD